MRTHHLNAAAEADLLSAHAYCLKESGADLADRFLFAVEDALEHIGRHPGTGSPRYANAADLIGLRFWLVSSFPYAVSYIERDTFIEIVRVLHQASDIPVHIEP